MPIPVLVLAPMLALLAASSGSAEQLVTFEMQGTVRSFAGGANPPPGVGNGSRATVFFTFDADQPVPMGPVAIYEDAVICVQLVVGPLRLASAPDAGSLSNSILVADDAAFPGAVDQYVVNQGLLGDIQSFLLSLLADQRTDGIDGLGLPTAPPPLDAFDDVADSEVQIQTATVSARFNAYPDLFRLAAQQPAPGEPFVCPEPAGAGVAAVLGLVALRRRDRLSRRRRP